MAFRDIIATPHIPTKMLHILFIVFSSGVVI
jgi:hypothetical protein